MHVSLFLCPTPAAVVGVVRGIQTKTTAMKTNWHKSYTSKPKRQSLHSFHYQKTYIYIQYSGYHALWGICTTSVGEACTRTDWRLLYEIEGIDYCVLFKRLNELGLTWDVSWTTHGAATEARRVGDGRHAMTTCTSSTSTSRTATMSSVAIINEPTALYVHVANAVAVNDTHISTTLTCLNYTYII